MKNLNTKELVLNDFDFDDYFMQNITFIEYKSDIIKIVTQDRKPLEFHGVIIESAELMVFKKIIGDKLLYSLYVKDMGNRLHVELTVLCKEKICKTNFIANKIK